MLSCSLGCRESRIGCVKGVRNDAMRDDAVVGKIDVDGTRFR